jgi:hypothetical protein
MSSGLEGLDIAYSSCPAEKTTLTNRKEEIE